MNQLDQTDKQLLNIVQSDFPGVPRPYQHLAHQLEISEDEVLTRLERMKAAKVIRQISAIFDTRALGYQSTLVAMAVDQEQLEEAAKVVNAHPGVSHNYKRNHAFNLWFTVATPPTTDIEATVEALHRLTGATSTRILPTLRLFKIGVELDMTGEADLTRRSTPQYSSDKRAKATGYTLTDEDIRVVRALQDDLELTPRPFLKPAQNAGMTEEELLAGGERLKTTGHLRRYAAILFHRRVGFAANGMAVWAVPEERADEVGATMASFSVVSHCYKRPTYEDWKYNIFTMLHGRKVGDCQQVAEEMAKVTGVSDYTILYSTKEYKKTRVRYFTPDYEAWDAKYLATPVATVG
jgi:DNA-binding Lrp family transcriptional regulator